MNAVGGIRQSTALTYLAQARDRPNLTIRSDVLVDNVRLEGRRVVGVRLAEPDEVLDADRTVLAAGSYGSPAVLMRSGIGPAEHLKDLGIPVKVDLPGVGENLADHPLFALRLAAPPAALDGEPTIYFQTILTTKSSLATGVHDLHIAPCSAYPVEPQHSPTGAVYLLLVSVTMPRSRGRLRLRSPDPTQAPVIDPGYLTHPDDMARMIEAVLAARRLSQTPPLSGLTVQELYPGPRASDTADLEAAVLAQADTYHHPVSTCRMGPATDAMAVVDARANVHGVENLSVVDASIMPAIPDANTNLPTIMLAERCSAWLVGTPDDEGLEHESF
jgi:choline dehydrogenase